MSGSFVETLEAVSPSSFAHLKAWHDDHQCPLGLLWKGDTPLPNTPMALVGEIVHHVMQYAASGTEPEELWREREQKVNSRLKQSWITSGLYPIEETVPRYFLKKKITEYKIKKTQSSTKPGVAAASFEIVMQDDELIESDNKKIRGKPDLVFKLGDEYTIIDYKSGDIFETDTGEKGEKKIKKDYLLQLVLYAALLKENGKSIRSAFLQTIDGARQEVDLTYAGNILNEAAELLDVLNRRLKNAGGAMPLAMPKPANISDGTWGCVGCLLRPVCTPYRHCSKTPEEGEFWPSDIFGKIVSKSTYGNSFSLKIERSESRGFIDITLTGRHAAVSHLKLGDSVGIFNSMRFRDRFVETPRTCVYQYVDGSPQEDWQIHLDILTGN